MHDLLGDNMYGCQEVFEDMHVALRFQVLPIASEHGGLFSASMGVLLLNDILSG